MQVKKIAFFECDKQREAFFRRHLSNFQLKFFPGNLSEQHLPEIKDCQIIFVVNYSPVTRSIVEQLPATRLITAGATGINNIDIKACADNGILVSNTPGYSADTVAEFTIALMLMLIRNAHTAFRQAKDNNFSWAGLMGQTLRGKTLGIVGTGRVGLKVIELARGFGMDIMAYNITEDSAQAARLGFTYVSLAKLLAASDLVSLHITANKDTYHFIDQEKMRLLKRGGFFINTSRGEVVDTRALIWALDQGIIRRAALDVLEDEKLCQENNLLRPDITAANMETYALNQHLLHRPEVLITPHIGWCTEEAIENMMNINLTNILSFINGHPENLVSAEPRRA